MEYIEQYVWVNENLAGPLTNGQLKVVLNYSNDRAPYALVEVISFNAQSNTNAISSLILKTAEIANNYTGTDNIGSVLAVCNYNTQIQAGRHSYQLDSFGSKLNYMNARTLNLYLDDENGVNQLSAGTILGFNLLIKVSYPKVGQIAPAYRMQIPL